MKTVSETIGNEAKSASNSVEYYPIVIIGAGAAGLFLAARLLTMSAVLILEKRAEAGRKLLLTGGSRCNLTHLDEVSELLNHYRPDARFLTGPLKRFGPTVMRNYFHDIGVATRVEANNRVFPSSNRASDVRDALVETIRRKKYEIRYNTSLIALRSLPSDSAKTVRWQLQLDNGALIEADHVILAGGGASYPGTGSDGKLLDTVAATGIPTTAFKAALTDLNWGKSEAVEDFVELSGISVQAAALQINKKKGRQSFGDILFTHKGLSGPAALNLSSDLDEEGSELKLQLFPSLNAEAIYQMLLDQKEHNARLDLPGLLSLWMPKKLSRCIVQRYFPTMSHLKLADLSLKQWRQLAEQLNGLILPPLHKGRLVSGMVSAGGISCKAIHPTTMELKDFPGLYACGEIIDINGDTGGYNLQAAFSTASAIAEHLSI